MVKTHRFNKEHVKAFDGAILIVRDPYKTMIAEYNRQFGGHTGYAPEVQYKNSTGKLSEKQNVRRVIGNKLIASDSLFNISITHQFGHNMVT